MASATTIGSNPAEMLTGVTLDGGWKVVKLRQPGPTSTGGFFSVGYFVEDSKGKIAFMKAFDFSRAFQAPDFTVELQKMTAAYNFERDLVFSCKKLGKVVKPITSGDVVAPGNFGPTGRVSYIIFEKAEGDIRDELDKLKKFDAAWALRSIHHSAVALQQMHTNGTAHQDVKPSNVMSFPESNEFKLGDLGRASSKSFPSQNDLRKIPGAVSYAPPEQSFGFRLTNDFSDRYSADIYLLGSLFFFYFLNVSATQMLMFSAMKLGININLATDFTSALPLLQRCFNDSLQHLEDAMEKAGSGAVTQRMIRMVGEMCDPDPRTRGNRKYKGSEINPQRYNVQRYVSMIDNSAKRIEMGILT